MKGEIRIYKMDSFKDKQSSKPVHSQNETGNKEITLTITFLPNSLIQINKKLFEN